jgi:hypothetical protein
MKVRTETLIGKLAENARPVRPLPRPYLRALAWLAIALPAVAAVVLMISPRPDLLERLGDARFVIEQAAALATAVAAAVAAFYLVVPGTNWKVALLPVPPLVVWVATLGIGCVVDWVRWGVEGLRLQPDLACFPYIAMVGVIPAVAIVVMLRRGAPLAPRLTLAFGGLAAAALGNFGLRFFHMQDAGIMVLVWQFGSVVVLSAIAGLVGQQIIRWRHRPLTR